MRLCATACGTWHPVELSVWLSYLADMGRATAADVMSSLCFVLTVSLNEDQVAYACSLEERCLDHKGCSWRSSMNAALDQVRTAMGVTMCDLFMVLGAAVKTRRLVDGHGVLYGEKTCVVRNGNTSWPFSAVRRTRGGSWVCLSCRTGDGTCDHAGTAMAAAKAHADGLDDSSDSDAEEEDGADETGLLESAGLTDTADEDVTGTTEVPPHLPAATEAVMPVNRYKWFSRSDEPRHLVPPLAPPFRFSTSPR